MEPRDVAGIAVAGEGAGHRSSVRRGVTDSPHPQSVQARGYGKIDAMGRAARRPSTTRVGYYLIILLAFALRAWRLTESPLWCDETLAVHLASQGVWATVVGYLSGGAEVFPTHGLFLSIWMALLGRYEYSLRFSSVFAGLPAVALVGRWAEQMVGRGRGWGAMLAMAIVPIFVYYNQEVWWPALAVTLATLFGWQAWRWFKGRGTLAAYVLSGWGLLWVHAFCAYLWVVVFLVGLVRWRVGGHGYPRRFSLHRWLGANALLGVLFMPVAVWTLWRAYVGETGTSGVGVDVLGLLPVLFGVGRYLPNPWAGLFAALMATLILVGMGGLLRTGEWVGLSFIALGLALPAGMSLYAGMVSGKWLPRYVLPSWGLAYVIGAGVGAAVLGRSRQWRSLGLALSAAAVAIAVPAVAIQAEGKHYVLSDETYPRPDFRGLAQYIELHDAPGDVILVVAGQGATVLDYYYDGPAAIHGVPETLLLDFYKPFDLHGWKELAPRLSAARVIWLVLWREQEADPTDLVQTMLMDSCPRLEVGASFGVVNLLAFDGSHCRPFRTTPSVQVDAPFSNGLRLTGLDVEFEREVLVVDAWWQAMDWSDDDYTTFVHLFREPEQSMEALIAQDDRLLGNSYFPTTHWPPGTLLRMRHVLPVKESCQRCLLRIGMYNEEGRPYVVSVEPGEAVGDAVEILLEGSAAFVRFPPADQQAGR